jgi:4-alpha-glucanotransferase
VDIASSLFNLRLLNLTRTSQAFLRWHSPTARTSRFGDPIDGESVYVQCMAFRFACVTVPLFSLREVGDVGIGDIAMLARFGGWAKGVGFAAVQILPCMALVGEETSPYGAISGFAIDPIYLSLRPDWLPQLRSEPTSAPENTAANTVNASSGLPPLPRAHVEYDRVRIHKLPKIVAAMDRLLHSGLREDRGYRSFLEAEAKWLLPFAQTMQSIASARPFDLGTRAFVHTDAKVMTDRICAAQYCLDYQWRKMREVLAEQKLALIGDVPFTVARDSCDVQTFPEAFELAGSLGVPPDEFAAEGQDWGLPPYAMDQAARYQRARMKRMAALYDAVRVDHVVGYFRQWVWRKTVEGRQGAFDSQAEEATVLSLAQAAAAESTTAFVTASLADDQAKASREEARGLAMLSVLREAFVAAHAPSAKPFPVPVFAEDLGVIPEYVGRVLRVLEAPGYVVLPWHRQGELLSDPRGLPSCSVVTWSTHDTPPLRAFWRTMPERDRARHAFLAKCEAEPELSPADEAALLRLAMQSSASSAFFLVQEVLGEEARINTPGTVGPQNWSYRTPTLEDLETSPHYKGRADLFASWLREAGRWG